MDATPENGTVQFDIGPSSTGGVAIHLVHDSEPIDPEDMAKIFVPFQRPDFDPDDDIYVLDLWRGEFLRRRLQRLCAGGAGIT